MRWFTYDTEVFAHDFIVVYKEGYRKKEIGVLEIGATVKDLAHAEGLPTNATKKEREAYHDFMSHIAHCSICGGMHDYRTIEVGNFCKYCGAYMVGKINDKR